MFPSLGHTNAGSKYHKMHMMSKTRQSFSARAFINGSFSFFFAFVQSPGLSIFSTSEIEVGVRPGNAIYIWESFTI